MTENTESPAVAAVALPMVAATTGARAIARLIDFVLLGIVNAVIVGVIVIGALLGQSGGTFVLGASGFVAGAVSAVLGAGINLAYFGVLESHGGGGQTLGKRIMKLRVVDVSGGVPSYQQALRRNIWVGFGIAGVVPVVGGLLGSLAQLAAVVTIAIGISADKRGGRGWHDQLAGETLVTADRGIGR